MHAHMVAKLQQQHYWPHRVGTYRVLSKTVYRNNQLVETISVDKQLGRGRAWQNSIQSGSRVVESAAILHEGQHPGKQQQSEFP